MTSHLANPSHSLPPEAEQHLRTCERCREMRDFVLAAHTPSETAPPELVARIRERVRSESSSVTPLPSHAALTARIWLAALILPALSLVALAPRALAHDPGRVWSSALLIAGSQIMLATAFSAFLSPLTMRNSAAVLRLLWTGLVWLTLTLYFFLGTGTALFDRAAPACLAAGLGVALVVGFSLIYVARRGAVLNWDHAGALAGGMAGLSGLFMLTFHCAVPGVYHQAFWHGMVLLLSSLTGWIVGRIADARVAQRLR